MALDEAVDDALLAGDDPFVHAFVHTFVHEAVDDEFVHADAFLDSMYYWDKVRVNSNCDE